MGRKPASLHEFVRLYWDRQSGSKIKIPKAMGAPFSDPASDDERRIKTSIDAFDADQIAKLEQDLAKQQARLADAERALQTKPTKAAAESKRIATDKIAWTISKLADLRHTNLTQSDSRIFPGQYAPSWSLKTAGESSNPCATNADPQENQRFTTQNIPALTTLDATTWRVSGKTCSVIRTA
jgi:hypothetical protein